MKDKKYIAFISYQRQDEFFAENLRKKLEYYRLPSNIRKQDETLPKYIRPVFRDSLELAGGILAQEIETALSQSKYLIVICSPRSAQSPWVNKEIETFIKTGREQYIIPYIVDGEPFAKESQNECYPPALRALSGENELLGINIKELGHDASIVKIVARMFGLQFDTLWQRHEREQRRKKWATIGISLFIAAISIIIGGYIYQKNIELEKTNWNMMRIQSRLVAEKAIELVDEGDSYTARLLCLDILPQDLDNPDRPFIAEAEAALRYTYKHNHTTLRGHKFWTNYASFSPDGKYIISAASDSTIRIWDAVNGSCVNTLRENSMYVKIFNFSPDGKYILSRTDVEKNSIKIWDVINGVHIKTLEGHTNCVTSASFSPDNKYIVTASQDSTIKIWDTHSWECIKTLRGHKSSVRSASFSPDGNYIVSNSSEGRDIYVVGPYKHRKYYDKFNIHYSSDETVLIWDTHSWECINTLKENDGTRRIDSAIFSPDGKYIIIISKYAVIFREGPNDVEIKIWDVNREAYIKTIKLTTTVNNSSFSSDGKYFVTALQDSTLKIWNTHNWKHIETLTGHTDRVNTAYYSPDGKYIVSASEDSTLKIWDTHKWECINTLRGDKGGVSSASFSPDGNYIIYRSEYTVGIWGADNKSWNNTLKGHISNINSVSYSPDGKYIISASKDSTIKIWDAIADTCIETLTGHTDCVNTAYYSPDGKYIISASTDNTIKIWDAYNRACVKTLDHHTNWINSISYSSDREEFISITEDNNVKSWYANNWKVNWKVSSLNFDNTTFLSPDGDYIIAASKDNNIYICDAVQNRNYNKEMTLTGHKERINSAYFSSDEKYIVSASNDSTIKIWDAKKAICLQTINNESCVNAASFSRYGRYIVSALNNNTIKIWDTDSWECIKVLDSYTSAIKSIFFSPEDNYIVSYSTDNCIRIWDAHNWKCIKTVKGYTSNIKTEIFSPDEKYLASIHTDTIKILDTQNWECIATLKETDQVNTVLFSLDGKQIISASRDNTIKIWDTHNWECIDTIKGADCCVESATFSPDGKYIVSASNDNTIKIWDAIKGTSIRSIEADTRTIPTISPDGKYIVSVPRIIDHNIQIYDIANNKCDTFPVEHYNGVTSIHFSPNGEYIASASMDNTISIINTNNQMCIKTLEGHLDWVNSAIFSPDGKYIITTSYDNTIKIWETENWICINTIEVPSVKYASFSPDGKEIICISGNEIHIIDFPSVQDLINDAKKQFENRQLTPEEKQMYYLK